jgi:hypothetical protein
MAIGAIANRTFCCRDAPERQVAEVLPLVLGGFYIFFMPSLSFLYVQRQKPFK